MQRWFGEQLGQHGAPRNTWSHAPMPSTDNAMGLASVKTRIMYPTQSVPALVERANWNGAQTRSTSFARLFATNLLHSTVPLQQCCHVCLLESFEHHSWDCSREILGGTRQHLQQLNIVETHLKQFVGALRSEVANTLASDSTGVSGVNSMTSSGMG